jgi:phosphoglycolate phosphatase
LPPNFTEQSASASSTPARKPGAVLFDLDGTLIDSVPDITLAVAELTHAVGLAPFTEDEVRRMVGHGLRKLVERVFTARGVDLDEAGLDARAELMAAIYPKHLVGRTALMAGAMEALSFLAASRTPLAVVTNKLQDATETILQHFDLARHFAVVVGDAGPASRRGLACKPEPDMLHYALSELGVAPADAIMVGDSSADILAAAAAGVFSVAVRGGYSADPIASYGPDLVIDSLADLPAALARWTAPAD